MFESIPLLNKALFRQLFELIEQVEYSDPGHDLSHIIRVLHNAQKILEQSNHQADHFIISVSILLHDCVSIPKDNPDSKNASTLSAQKAMEILEPYNLNQQSLENIYHAIEAHSYSRGITPTTLEAKIVQDADRLDALGAIGIARLFAVAGATGRAFYDLQDPMAKNRELDDKTYSFDHFSKKILKLPEQMQTQAGREIAQKRVEFVRLYLEEFLNDVSA